jgi:phosphatidylglycerophosphatase A
MTISAERPCAGVWRNPVHLLAFAFGTGCLPVAPGTFGTLVGVVLYCLLRDLPFAVYLIVVAGAFALGVWLCARAARDLGVHDHGSIVWDEVVGYLITMAAAPEGWFWVVTGFVLFRLFDIVKPWPIHVLDKRIGGGIGIMIDDAVAGVCAWLILQGLALFVISPG